MSATEVKYDTSDLPDYAPIPNASKGEALNEQGYYVGRVERNLYWITDGVYQSAFLTTSDGVVALDAPPTIGNNIQRAIGLIVRSTACGSMPAASSRACTSASACMPSGIAGAGPGARRGFCCHRGTYVQA